MTKLYSMDQHSQAIKMKFSVSFTYGNQDTPHSVVHCKGVGDTFRQVSSWGNTKLTLDKMFEMFIIEGRNKHKVIYLDDKGELVNTIRIVKEK